MLKRKRIVSVLIVLAILVGVSTTVFAVKQQQQITVTYGMSLFFNDQKSTLRDANGGEVQPFVYQGTTYVPIRGVSQLFGADVSYDAASNSAYIYDDFSEACAVVHQMSNIVNEGFLVYQDMILEATTTDLGDLSQYESAVETKITNMYELLEELGNTNANIGIIIQEILPSYSDFVVSFVDTYTAYKSLQSSRSSYAANKFADSAHALIENYYATINSIDSFFNDYCCWRDLGF